MEKNGVSSCELYVKRVKVRTFYLLKNVPVIGETFFLLETFYRLKYRQSVGGRNDILLEFVFYVVKYRRKKICVLVIFHFCELLRILIRRTSVS